jgi:hypothetical protein
MRSIAITPSRSGLQSLMPAREWQQIMNSSVARWNHALEQCCSVRLVVTLAQDKWLATEDGVNLVVLRQGLWCHNESCGHTSTFAPNALAMTTAYPEGATGVQVREADIEINPRMLHVVSHVSLPMDPALQARATESGLWVFGPRDTQYPVPLEAVLVHELGHVLGLGDACTLGHEVGGLPVVVDCTSEQRERVMFPDAHQMVPTAADLEELAQMYPAPNHSLAQPWTWLTLSLAVILLLSAAIWRVRRARESKQ